MSTPIDTQIDSTKTRAVIPEQRDNWRGMMWMLFSVISSSIMAIAVRYGTQEISSIMVVFYRATLSGLIICCALLLYKPFRAQLKFSQPKTHIIRGLCIGVSTNLGFYTISVIPIATATVLFFTAPIFATLLGVLIHKETLGPRRIAASVFGFLGALVILKPGFGEISFGMITAIVSSLLFACALTMSRGLAQKDGALSTYFSSVIITFLVTAPIAAPSFAVPQMTFTWLAIITVGLTSISRGIADIQAYRHAEASVLTPLAYLRVVFTGIAGYALFSETPDLATVIGTLFIVGSTFYISHRERVTSRKSK